MVATVHPQPREGLDNVHHPEPACPDRIRIIQAGNDLWRKIPEPYQKFDALDGDRRAHQLRECPKCLLIRRLREMGQS